MADVVTTWTTGFTVQRLRSWNPRIDAAGAVVGSPYLPQPIAVAKGPSGIVPASAVGANEYLINFVPVPAVPDVCWVVAQGAPNVRRDVTLAADTVSRYAAMCFGSNVGGLAWDGPLLAAGGCQTVLITDGTSFEYLDYLTPDDSVFNCWSPLDPADTKDGWTMGVSLRAGTSGFGINSLRLSLKETILLGYPVNYWDTGAIWTGMGT